jgi:hypothetical protein
MNAVVRNRTIYCGRPGCWNRLALLADEVTQSDGRWIRVAKLIGSGWHRRERGEWWPEDLARRRGKKPIHSTLQPVSVEVDWSAFPRGFDPAASDELRLIPKGRPRGLVVIGYAEERDEVWLLRPADVVRCRKCGAPSTIAKDILRVLPAHEARLRAAGLWHG